MKKIKILFIAILLCFSAVTKSQYAKQDNIVMPKELTGKTNNLSACKDINVPMYQWVFNGGGQGFSTPSAALSTFTGGPVLLGTRNFLVTNDTWFYLDSNTYPPKVGHNLWYCLTLIGTTYRYAVQIDDNGKVISYTS